MKARIVWPVLAVAVLALGAAYWPETWQGASAAGAAQGAPAAQRTVTHAQGESFVPQHLERVVVFDVGALDILDALGVDVVGVAGLQFPDYLAQYASGDYLNLGTLFEPDYERVNAAGPDLIITGGRSSDKFSRLARIAPTVDVWDANEDTVQTTYRNARLLSSLFGKEDQAEERIAHLSDKIAALRARTAERGTGLVVLVTGGRMSAYGPGSRFGSLHTDFGVPAAADLEVSLHGEAIGSEFILKTNPDWLFVLDRDTAIGETGAAQQVLNNPLVQQTTAWKQKQVVYLDPKIWYLTGGGVQALEAMIEQIDRVYSRGQVAEE